MAPTAVALAASTSQGSDAPPRSLQEAVRHSTVCWQRDLEALFKHAKDRFPDVVWELVGEDDDRMEDKAGVDEVWGHKAIVYARAPPSFQSRYFSFRPNTAEYPVESTTSFGDSLASRAESPFGSVNQSSGLLRITTSINPALFSNELEYLYTGQGFGEAFEFLFDTSETREAHHMLTAGVEDELDAEGLRIDKLRKDLVFMWRSRLYSDVRIALTGNFSSSNHENTTAIFSSHRFILVSRCPYFYDQLINWPMKTTPGEPPTLTLESTTFTPASLHFTLGYIYTGTLVFSHRSYDLSTAFAILRAALFLQMPSLHDEVQARIVQEMCHGLFHAFVSFPEYEKITQGKWGTTGCRCRQCARRAPRVLEFSLLNEVQNAALERGARRALVGMFGEGWCNQEFASMPQKIREGVLRGVAKRTTPVNAFPLLFAAEHALVKLGPVIEPWADTVRDMVLQARKVIDEVITKESDACFNSEEWIDILETEGEAEGARFGDYEKVEWAMAAVMRGVKDAWAATLYQTLVSSILLRPHPTEESEALLSATSKVRKYVEDTRADLQKWIEKRWLNVRQEHGFDQLEGWAIKEISDFLEVSIEDLLNPPHSTHGPSNTRSPARTPKTAKSTLLRPVSQHPHTSRIDSDSDLASMRASVLSRNTTSRSGTTTSSTNNTHTTGPSTRRRVTPNRGGDGASIASSIRSSSRSTATFETSGSGSTVGRSPALRRKVVDNGSPSANSNAHLDDDDDATPAGHSDSPAKRIAASVRARNGKARLGAGSVRSGVGSGRSLRERPDSKLTPEGSVVGSMRAGKPPPTPSIVESRLDDDFDDEYSVLDEEGVTAREGDDDDDVNGEGDEEDMESVLGSGVAGDGDGEDVHDSGVAGVDGEDDDGDSTPANSILSHTTTGTTPSKRPLRGASSSLSTTTHRTPPKKAVVSKASLSSMASRSTVSTAASRVKSGAASTRSGGPPSTTTRKTSGSSLSVNTNNRNHAGARPNSRTSTRSSASRITTTSMSASSRSTLSTLSSSSTTTTSSRAISRPVSRASTVSTAAGRPASTVSTTTESTNTSFRTAPSGGGGSAVGATLTPTSATTRARKTSAASTVSVKTTGTARTSAGDRQRTTSTASTASTAMDARQRKVSTSSVSSVASGKRSPVATRRSAAPPVPSIDRSKLGVTPPGGVGPKSPGVVKAPGSLKGSVSASSPSTGKKPVVVVERKKSAGALSTLAGRGVVAEAREKFEAKKDKDGVGAAVVGAKKDKAKDAVAAAPAPVVVDEKENVQPVKQEGEQKKAEPEVPAAVQADHRKTTSSASTSSVSSVATVKRRGSVDTITSRGSGSKPGLPAATASRVRSPPLPPVPVEDDDTDSDVGNTTIHGPTTPYTGAPRGATLDIGIPCIISSKRKRFKAYARYIGEVEGEKGPWVGVEVPLPVGSGGDPWGDRSASSMSMNSSGGNFNSNSAGWPDDDRQWHDGSWGGVRYFEISGGGKDDWGEDRASRRRRVDGGSAGSGVVWGPSASISLGKGTLKREAEGVTMSLERMMKRVRSASPAGSETSSMMESRGLFVRPQQVLYVVDAVGADL